MEHALFNLIVYTDKAQRKRCFKEMVEKIATQFPCKLIFIKTNPANPKNEISVHKSYLKESASSSKTEVIEIVATGQLLEQIPYLILPQIIADIPTYLLWGQTPDVEQTVLPNLQEIATRVIFDSEAATDLASFTSEIVKLKNSSQIELVDMNWIATSGWRNILARSFDTKLRLELLKQTSEIKICYNLKESHNDAYAYTQSFYIQAWLASCLNWELKQCKADPKHNYRIEYEDGTGAKKNVYLYHERCEELEDGEIIELELSSKEVYHCLFRRESEAEIKVKASSHYQCLLPFSLLLPRPGCGKNLMQNTFYKKISLKHIVVR